MRKERDPNGDRFRLVLNSRPFFLLTALCWPSPTISMALAQDDAGQAQVIWQADHEDGTLDAWTDAGFRHAGGGILNTGGEQVLAVATREQARFGDWSAKVAIYGASRARNGKRAVRLMRWTDRAWDDGGNFLPASAYYSAWYYFPRNYNPRKHPPWDPGDGGWWNIFQFKGEDENGKSQPLWALNVNYDPQRRFMYASLYSDRNRPFSFQQANPQPIPVGKWVLFEAYYKAAAENRGEIGLWQDGTKIFDLPNVVTSLGGKRGDQHHPVWGVGSYTDHIAGDPDGEGTATIYIDDAMICTQRRWTAND